MVLSTVIFIAPIVLVPVQLVPAELCIQEARTLEELQMQHLERKRTLAYFAFMQQQAEKQAAAKAAAHTQLAEAVDQCLSSDADMGAVARLMQGQLEDMAQLMAEHIIMQHWSERFGRCGQVAAERFGAL
jgi:hypothetical protein